MNPWKQLLDVQALDTQLTQLEHREQQLPERVELRELDDQLAGLRTEIAEVEQVKHELEKNQKRIEDEIALIDDKIGNAERQLYGGASSDSKQLQALQDEIASFRSRISALEDDELELMEQMEPVDDRLRQLSTRQAELDQRATELTKIIAEAEAEIDTERQGVLLRRSELAQDVPSETLAEYDKVRRRLGGVAVARLAGGVCGACHMKLSAVENDRIQHLPPDEPVECEDCGRYLVRD